MSSGNHTNAAEANDIHRTDIDHQCKSIESSILSSPSKRAVYIMNATNGLYSDPIHYHSFCAVGSGSIFAPAAGISLFSGPKCFFVGTFHKCAACHNRLGSSPPTRSQQSGGSTSMATSEMDAHHVHSSSSSSGMEMLYCVACGVYAHRSCAFARLDRMEPSEEADGSPRMPLCEVNQPLVEAALKLTRKRQSAPPHNDVPAASKSPKTKSSWSIFGRRTDEEDNTENETKANSEPNDESEQCSQQSSTENNQSTEDKIHKDAPNLKNSPKESTTWSIFGRRKGDEKIQDHDEVTSIPTIESTAIETCEGQSSNEDTHDALNDEKSSNFVAMVHFGRKTTTNDIMVDEANDSTAGGDANRSGVHLKDDAAIADPNQIHNVSADEESSLEREDMSQSALEDMLTRHDKSENIETTDSVIPPPPGAFRTSIEIIRKTTQTTANIPKAYSIGMVAGGVAGLAIAGPAGAVMGSQIGKTVLAVGAAVEGGMSLGVLVLSLVAAAKYSHKSKDERELELPGHETCALVLVRPDVAVDPIWGKYAEEAREAWKKMNKDSLQSSWGSGFGGLFSAGSNEQTDEIRYHRDVDIITADASELAMREKVFLLVNRILNDKRSLPGYVYRYLIRKCIVRSTSDEASPFGDASTILPRFPSHSRRQDAHGVIKHVTATLLEVREGLAFSPALTEMSAGAVEMLVFGELYSDVFGELVEQTREQEGSLLAKVESLRLKCGSSKQDSNEKSHLSQSAITALKMLPEAHTPADKLFYSVQFLECVSAHFSTLYQDRCIDADALLKMVCQHIVAANVTNLHAEVAFIEEFSRDEQLLRGKEGYALITLQASLHYLDSLDQFDDDLYPI
ncbi:hypothetical protein HJC23_004207 [Cyclotella cryptica]|uniref:VPS9 domain-containing protein n=1 Tax=Cyclotella cryptica TaxID=29204 RepID=A0ABD3QE10_9STRA